VKAPHKSDGGSELWGLPFSCGFPENEETPHNKHLDFLWESALIGRSLLPQGEYG
jgi:hypothetical protein